MFTIEYYSIYRAPVLNLRLPYCPIRGVVLGVAWHPLMAEIGNFLLGSVLKVITKGRGRGVRKALKIIAF